MPRDLHRLVGVDVLRAFAVTGVLAAHLSAPPGLLQSAHGLIEQAAWRWAGAGGDGVILFFAISGFVIARTILERDGSLARMHIGAFYIRRIARIWPALILSLTLGIIALLAASQTSPASFHLLLGDVPLTPAFWLSIATFTFNFFLFHTLFFAHHDFGYHWGVLWSLSVEEQFYLFFPLLARRAATSRRLCMALFGLVVVGVASRYAIRHIPGIWLYLTPSCLDPLAIGVAAALLPRFSMTRDWSLRGAVLGLALLILAAASASLVATPLLIAVGAALVMLCCQNGAVFTGRVWQPLARIGRVSYGMYLFHPLVLWGLTPLLQGMALLPALALFVAAAWFVAEISFALVERPVSRLILGRRTTERGARIAVAA